MHLISVSVLHLSFPVEKLRGCLCCADTHTHLCACTLIYHSKSVCMYIHIFIQTHTKRMNENYHHWRFFFFLHLKYKNITKSIIKNVMEPYTVNASMSLNLFHISYLPSKDFTPPREYCIASFWPWRFKENCKYKPLLQFSSSTKKTWIHVY